MANTILITANWHTGALSQQTISRQYDNNRYVVQFVGYPEASEGNELDYYLLVWMSSAPGETPDEIAPIQLASDQWYISNVFTQQTQQIKFQMCALNTEGTFEAHSPIFTGFVRNSLEHDGTTQDIDVSTLFDAYREYLNELIIRAGAVVIDPTLSQSGQAAAAKETGDLVGDLIESTITATLDISRFKTYSYWSFGSKVNPVNGYTSANEPAYCRTTWVSLTQPVMVLIDDPNYEWCVWGYVSNTSAGGAYTPSARYGDNPVIVRPINGAVYFRIGVRRKDEATLTTDYSDTTSDAYKIINSLRTFILASDVLSDGNVPITGKAVMDNALVFKGGVPNGTDLNTVITAGVYYITSGNTYINSPTSAGILFVYKVNTFYAQLLYTFGESDSFIPVLYSRFAVGASVTAIATKWRMVGKYRKRQVKMVCFGDSIMYGQNGNTSSQVEEQYRIPSMLAYNLNIDTTNYGVGSQGYIGMISEKAYDNISSKDLTQFNAMLMCYGVNDGYRDLGTWDSTDEATIMGQFNKIVAYVFSQNPSIRLIVVAPYNGRNVGTFPKYWYGDRTHPDGYVSRQVLSDTLKQACEYYNIPYIEQKNSPINGYTIQTLIGTDGVHPSLEGYFQLGAWLSGEVGRLIG